MTKSLSFRTDVQGLRGVAIILVLLFHFETPLRGGYLGVDMFFVISGFVIAASTLREIDRTNAFSWGTFLHRRVRRLLPGMVLVTTATAIASLLLLSPFGPQQETAKMLLSAATYTSNFVLMPQSYFSLDPKANPLLHLWSLAVEEQIYFIWPIAIVGFLGIRTKLNTTAVTVFAWSITTLTVICSAWLFVGFSHNGASVRQEWWFEPLIQRDISPEVFAFYSPLTRAWEFGIGVFVALIIRKKLVPKTFLFGLMHSSGGAVLVAIGLFWATQKPEIQHGLNWSTNTSATMAVVAGTALWILGGSQRSWVSTLLTTRPLTWMGDCSYSIYLLHWPIWVFLVTFFDQNNSLKIVAVLLSIGIGWLQFRFIEEPIQIGKKLIGLRAPKVIGLFGSAAVGLFMVMSNLTPAIAEHLSGRNPNEIAFHASEKPCTGTTFVYQSVSSCVFGSESSKSVAILVGDSMAKSLSNGFVQAVEAEGLKGYVFTLPGCPFLVPKSPFAENNECIQWRSDVFFTLNRLAPQMVVISNLSSLYVETNLPDLNSVGTKRLWGEQLSLTIGGMEGLNTHVIVAQPPPRFAYDLRYDISLIRPNSVIEPRSEVVNRRKEINQIEENAISGMQHVRPTINFTDLFCDSQLCDPRVEGIFMYEDSDHLSVEGSIFVAEQLRIAITETMLVYVSSLSK